MNIIMCYLYVHPNEWTTFIYQALRSRTSADRRKQLQLLKQLEKDGYISKKKNAINNYVWNLTDLGRKQVDELRRNLKPYDLCAHCLNGSVELKPASQTYSTECLICNKCDSTFLFTR